MSLADAVAANYEEQLTKYGKWIEVRRMTGGNQQTIQSCRARARIRGGRTEEALSTMVGQHQFVAKILIKDLIDGQYPLPVRINDKITFGGPSEKTIDVVDNQTGWVGNTQIFVTVYGKG